MERESRPSGLFFWLYWGIALVVYFAALPVLLLVSFKKKYRHSLPARFFLYRNGRLAPGCIWFHACSLGETKSLEPLLEQLRGEPIGLTVTTQTGFAHAKTYAGVARRYLPFEIFLPWWSNRPKTLVVTEAELWPMLFWSVGRQGGRTFLVNARISERSFGRYRRFGWLYRRVFAGIDRIYAQSEEDRLRLEALGAADVEVFGNIKLFRKVAATKHYAKPAGWIVTAASTHEGEEELVLSAFARLRMREPEAKLIIVPRHPERFAKVAAMGEQFAAVRGMRCGIFSRDGFVADDILVVDAMGELVNIYAVSDLVVLGGSFIPAGGHNPLEPAAFGCRLISGEHMFHQKELFAKVDHAVLVGRDALGEALANGRDLAPTRLRVRGSLEALAEAIRG